MYSGTYLITAGESSHLNDSRHHTGFRREHNVFERLTFALILAHIFAFFFLPVDKSLFLLGFLFWRACYNIGLGYLLHRQSKENWVTYMSGQIFEKYPWIKTELYKAIGQRNKGEVSKVQHLWCHRTQWC